VGGSARRPPGLNERVPPRGTPAAREQGITTKEVPEHVPSEITLTGMGALPAEYHQHQDAVIHEDDGLMLVATACNTGDAASGAFRVRLILDGTAYHDEDIAALGPGEERWVIWEHSAVDIGWHALSVFLADDGGEPLDHRGDAAFAVEP
jgi:hypothetical protein